MSNYEILKERLREAPSNEWSGGMLCAAADAIDNLEQQMASQNGRELFVVVADDLEIEHSIYWVAAAFSTESEAFSYVRREERKAVWDDWKAKRDAWMAAHYPIPGDDAESSWPQPPDGEQYGFRVFRAVIGKDAPTKGPRPEEIEECTS